MPEQINDNDIRAERAEAALAEYGSDDEALRDILSDLMHWADRKGVDFSEELAFAEGHYEAEVIEAQQEA